MYQLQQPSIEASKAMAERLHRRNEERRKLAGARPKGWRKPSYGTPDYIEGLNNGWITLEEQHEDVQRFYERRRRSRAAIGHIHTPNRHSRPAPRESRQYAGAMATTAARDDRLTPQAKACLQLIRAWCGNTGWFNTCVISLCRELSRSLRSVQRYMAELKQFGYIRTEIRHNARGADIGVKVALIVETVLPFFAKDEELAEWLMQTNEQRKSVDSCGVTKMPSINVPLKNLSIFGGKSDRQSAFGFT